MARGGQAVGVGTVLDVRGIWARYSRTPVLRDISLEVPAGAVVAVLGPNGAGKSTLLNAVCGLARVTKGSVTFEGQDITKWRTCNIMRAGVSYAPQGRRMFPYMTAEQNLRIGAYNRRDRPEVRNDVDDLCRQWPVLATVRHRRAGALSGGEQQIVALGRSLLAKPSLLLLDEPSLGLAPVLVNELYDALHSLVNERHQSMILVEQNISRALGLADYVYVLARGQIVGSGPPSSMTEQSISSLYFRSVHSTEGG